MDFVTSFATFIMFALAILLLRLWWLQRNHGHPAASSEGVIMHPSSVFTRPDSEEVQEVIAEIRRITSVDELVEFIERVDVDEEILAGRENDELLERVRQFESDLDADDFAAILRIADTGTELETFADEAGE